MRVPRKPDARTRGVMQALGSHCLRERTQRRLTQETAALALGVDPSYYAKIERGEVNVTIGMFVAICRLFGWDLPTALRRD